MKNIFVEGIQGAGKSTLVNNISKIVPDLRVCREGDYSPADLAWCAYLSEDEYEKILEKYKSISDEIIENTVKEEDKYIISYTKIITDIPGFHKDLENYEVYNGRKTFTELKEIIFTRFMNFKETGYLFECSLFQNIIEDLMLFHMLGDEEIIAFYCELFNYIDAEDYVLFYLYSDKLEANIKTIKKERCDDKGNELWYEVMLQYISCSPYGKKYGCNGFDGLVNHLRHRQELELTIIKELMGENAVVLSSKDYDLNKLKLEGIISDRR